MRTKEIVNGAPPVEGRPPVVQPENSESELGAQFSQLLQGMIGGAGLDAVLGTIGGMGMVQVSIAAAKEQPVEIVEEEAPANEEELAVTEEEDSYVRTEEDTEQSEEQTVVEAEEAVVCPVVIGQAVAVQETEVATEGEQAAAEVTTAVELPKVLEQMLQTEQQQVVTEGGDEAQVFTIQQAAQAALKPEKKGAATETAGQVQAVESAQGETGAPVVKVEAAKGVSKDVNQQRSEDYFAIQRALEASESAEEPAPILRAAGAQPAFPSEKLSAAVKQTAAQEAAAAQLARGGVPQDQAQTGTRNQGLGNDGIGAVMGGNSLGRLVSEKLKAAKEVPAKDRQKIVEQMKEMVQKAIQVRDGNSISVRLNPPELGQMTVKVTQREDKVYARIIPETPEVERLLRERANDVTQVLVAAGLKADQVHVSIGRERTEAETHQFHDLLGRGNAEERQDKPHGRDGAGGQAENHVPFTSMTPAEEQLLSDSGWVA